MFFTYSSPLSSFRLYDVFRLMVFLVFIQSCQSNKCTFYECSPEITSLDHMSINTTLTIRCIFRKRIENHYDIMWLFHAGKSERVINPMDGPTLEPFAHELIQVNGSQHGQQPHLIKSVSLLHIRLLNSTFFTNYTLMTVGDTCQINIRVHLQETAMSYINSSAFTLQPSSFHLILSLVIYVIARRFFDTSK